jgi:glycogen operon protein
VRNFFATLLLSQGVPMISHGDELGRTQAGNNNAYCQDNERSWIDWELTDERKSLYAFVSSLIHFRLSQPVLRRRKYFQGRSIRGVKDLAWLAPDGHEMTDEAWNADFVRSLGMLLSGHAIEEVDERGEPVQGDTVLVLFNAHNDQVPFALPALQPEQRWQRVFDTLSTNTLEPAYEAGELYPLGGRTVALFKVTPPLNERRRELAATRAAASSEPPVEQPEPVGA